MSKTITRADLGESIYQQVGLSRNESSSLVEMVLDEISKQLIDGKTVKISSFGSFSVRQKKERIGRNPKTGVEVPITPRKVLVFRASHVLKDRMNGITPTIRDGDEFA
jgi:integration host factor subunit alpha